MYVWHEPDDGGDNLLHAVSQDLPDVRVIGAPPDAKDPSELYLLDSANFKMRMLTLMRTARPFSELRAASAVHDKDVFASVHSATSRKNVIDFGEVAPSSQHTKQGAGL